VAVARDSSGRLFVTEQIGVIRIVRDGVVLPTPFLDITGRPEPWEIRDCSAWRFRPITRADNIST